MYTWINGDKLGLIVIDGVRHRCNHLKIGIHNGDNYYV